MRSPPAAAAGNMVAAVHSSFLSFVERNSLPLQGNTASVAGGLQRRVIFREKEKDSGHTYVYPHMKKPADNTSSYAFEFTDTQYTYNPLNITYNHLLHIYVTN
ncbi:hypothetical protein HanXRQr2_Chr14g0622751 [Helianthus annuus]|uniref:Uncharacterized protein n=1 Tax=Helianthus annuus TaxID=4232 RepID=A0A9K3H4N6_HELAN|nr:hypothetical protein HanXRQr2_Chr14g0622751 [Helianthus annuus]KAJ0838676.1 hypothetical protein HanPSC8_Chr14g0597571 [Helianthus annuus]